MKRQAHTVSVQRYEASNMGPSRCRYLGPDPLAINSQPNNQSRAIRQTPVLGCSPMDFTSAPFPIRALRRMVGVFRNNVDSAIHNGARKLSA